MNYIARNNNYTATVSGVLSFREGEFNFEGIVSDKQREYGLASEVVNVFPEIVPNGRVIDLIIWKGNPDLHDVVFHYELGELHEHDIRDFTLNKIVATCINESRKYHR